MHDSNYPFNLIRAIYGVKKTDNIYTETTYIKGLYEQLETLLDDEQEMLSMRFKEGLIIKDCAERFGVTPSRANQIINKALRKLRSPSRSKYYKAVPITELNRMRDKYQDMYEENQAFKETLRLLSEHEIEPQAIILLAKVLQPQHLELNVHELRLSTRAYNGLRRAGIFTIKDLINTPKKELIQLESIGKKTVEEIRNKLKAHLFFPDIIQDEQGDDNTHESNTL